MSKLSAFLHPVEEKREKEVIVSTRFRDEKDKPIPFKIRSLTQEENEAITKKSMRVKKINKQAQEVLDSGEYSRRIVVAATVEPDFSSKELCDGFGVVDPLLVPAKMLLVGEYNKLLEEIMGLSGIELENDIEEDAKN